MGSWHGGQQARRRRQASAAGGTTRGSARDRLLAAAAEGFYNHGVNGTGIDAITAAAGVAKMSLYNNFASKDDLVLAYLQARHEEWLDLYHRRLAAATGARAGIVAVFDAYIDHAEMAYQHGFRGCGLLNAAAELPAGAPGRAVVSRHKEDVEARAHARRALQISATGGSANCEDEPEQLPRRIRERAHMPPGAGDGQAATTAVSPGETSILN